MNVTVVPQHSISGEITAPPSKAETHRALVTGLLSDGASSILGPLSCDDTEATARAVEGLGASITRSAHTWIIQSDGKLRPPRSDIECGESGVTLRFLIPLASMLGTRVTLRGKETLMRRPSEPLIEALKELGVKVNVLQDCIVIEGSPPQGGTVRIPGDISSQFISGLIIAGAIMDNGLTLELTSPLESRNYVSLTILIMGKHGVKVQTDEEMTHFDIKAGQKYLPANLSISGDYSSAAFPLSAAAVTNSKVVVRNLTRDTLEPDAALIKIFSQMGAKADFLNDSVSVRCDEKLRPARINIRDSPDLGPITAVLGCYAEGETIISGAKRLRHKESDRIASIATELKAIGGDITETEDGLIVRGPSPLNGGIVRSHGDHRIAMALSVAALGASSPVTIEGAECVSKSYPNFFEDLRTLGVDVIG